MIDKSPLSGQFRDHFGHRDHLYGVLLEHLADDLDAGGPTADICSEHLGARRDDAISLRLLAGIFRIVLRGGAPELKPFYACLGGTAAPDDAWPMVRAVLSEHVSELRNALDLAPQTNEVGRAACLALGTFEAVRRHRSHRIRLLELGASAGLNLLMDQYLIVGPGWSSGPADSPLTLDTGAHGVRPEEFTIVDRRGCDVAPVDVTTTDGASYLTSFVWPFDRARHARLAAAITTAQHHAVRVDRAPASTWIADRLAEPVAEDVLTIVWQSITEQYWPRSERDAVNEAVDRARHRIPVARVCMEGVPPPQTSDAYAIDRFGPETRVDDVLVARSHHHGLPVVLM